MDTGAGLSAAGRLVATLCDAGCSPPILVLGAEGVRVRNLLPDRVRSACAAIIIHEGWAAGRTGSLQAGLAALIEVAPGAAAFLIAPVDRPYVRAATIATMARAFGTGRARGTRIVIPVHAGLRGHPVLCDLALADEFRALAPDAPASLVTKRDRARRLEIDVVDPGVADNLDTAEALDQARRREFGGR